MNLRLAPYEASRAAAWNAFVAASRNGVFQADRGFMDYHADRFVDASLVAWDGDRIVALLPAHRDGDTLVSHGGLSWGGFILGERGGQRLVLALFERLVAAMQTQGLRRLRYKTLPLPYQRWPSEDDRYALFRLGATRWRCELLSMLPPGPPPPGSELRRRPRRKTPTGADETLREDPCWAHFWPLLEAVLAERHGARPVHTLAEIQLLASRFPREIRLVTAWVDGRIAAGAVLFETPQVLRTQYLAAGPAARATSLLDRVIDHAIAQARATGRWFDFGTSTESGGTVLNEGLLAFKEGFGARTVAHDAYELLIP